MDLKKLKTKWTPSKSDIAWVERLFSVMNVGDNWWFEGGICQVDSESKILTIKAVSKIKRELETMARSIKVARMLGYTIKI